MSIRIIISIVTAFLITAMIYFGRHDIVHAWGLLSEVNVVILLLLIPVQIIVYIAGGEMIFSYLKDKKELIKVSHFNRARMALELNFVNHALPSGGVSGISYMSWRLGKLGVSHGRSTMAQLVRYVMGFIAYLVLLVLSLIFITLDGNINRFTILVSTAVACTIIFSIIFGLYVISSASRLHSFAGWFTRVANRVIRTVTFGRKKNIVQKKRIDEFFVEFHNDYLELWADKRILIKPFLWGLVFNFFDALLFVIGFWAIGVVVNPAAIIIAYGLAAMAGFIMLTPGGAGAYEAIMIGFLVASGIPQQSAIAAVVVTRAILLIGTIVSGYIFYQLSLLKYGKHST